MVGRGGSRSLIVMRGSTLATGGGTTVALTVVTLSALTCRATVLTAVRLTLLGYGETHLVALVTLLMIELRQRIGK